MGTTMPDLGNDMGMGAPVFFPTWYQSLGCLGITCSKPQTFIFERNSLFIQPLRGTIQGWKSRITIIMNHENYTMLPEVQTMLPWNILEPSVVPRSPGRHPRHWWLHWRERHWPFPPDAEAGPVPRPTLKKSEVLVVTGDWPSQF